MGATRAAHLPSLPPSLFQAVARPNSCSGKEHSAWERNKKKVTFCTEKPEFGHQIRTMQTCTIFIVLSLLLAGGMGTCDDVPSTSVQSFS